MTYDDYGERESWDDRPSPASSDLMRIADKLESIERALSWFTGAAFVIACCLGFFAVWLYAELEALRGK